MCSCRGALWTFTRSAMEPVLTIWLLFCGGSQVEVRWREDNNPVAVGARCHLSAWKRSRRVGLVYRSPWTGLYLV